MFLEHIIYNIYNILFIFKRFATYPQNILFSQNLHFDKVFNTII